MKDNEIRDAIATVSRLSGLGDNRTTMQNLFYGINHRGFGNPVPANTDHYGYTFFTRPCLNLSYHNLLGHRILAPLLNKDDTSIAKVIRAYLDPISNRGLFREELGDSITAADLSSYDTVRTPMVDELSPFISVLTNTLVSLSGWPDLIGDTFTSDEGMAREAYSMFDGIDKINNVFDITANFQNVQTDPITLMFHSWLLYGLSVRQGKVVPWPSNVAQQRIDYVCRMFRIVLDSSRTKVKKFASTICFPTTTTIGASFNYNRNIPVAEENRDIGVNFRCMGAEYNDPVCIDEFNRMVQEANPAMRPVDDNIPNSPPRGLANGSYKIITQRDRDYLNYRGYPLINTETMDITWYAQTGEWEGL